MFPMDSLRNIPFLALDIDRNVGGPPIQLLHDFTRFRRFLRWNADPKIEKRFFIFFYKFLKKSVKVSNLFDLAGGVLCIWRANRCDIGTDFSANQFQNKVPNFEIIWAPCQNIVFCINLVHCRKYLFCKKKKIFCFWSNNNLSLIFCHQIFLQYITFSSILATDCFFKK